MIAVLRQRDFALLWFAGLISMIGDLMLFVALPLTVYEVTGSALATSGILITRLVPSLVLGSIAGVFVDRWDRKRTMVISNLVRAPILLPLFAVDSADRVWIVYVVAFAVSTLGQFFGPAENALLPRLVSEDHLITANALNALNNNLSRLIGPAVGGIVAAWYGLGGVAAVDSASFLVAGVMIALIAANGRPERAPVVDAGTVTKAWESVWREWLAGLRLIRESRVLFTVFGVIAISSIGEGVMGSAFWVFIDEALDGGTKEAGWLVSAQAVGGLIGAMIIGRWGKTLSPPHLLGWGAIGLGLIDLITFNYPAFSPEVWPGLVTMAIVGVPAAAFGAGYTTAIQTEAEDSYRGRVFGAMRTTQALLMIAGATLAGLVTERIGSVAVLTVQSAAFVVAGVFALKMLGTTAPAFVRREEPTAR